jgi:hypothetical protein
MMGFLSRLKPILEICLCLPFGGYRGSLDSQASKLVCQPREALNIFWVIVFIQSNNTYNSQAKIKTMPVRVCTLQSLANSVQVRTS